MVIRLDDGDLTIFMCLSVIDFVYHLCLDSTMLCISCCKQVYMYLSYLVLYIVRCKQVAMYLCICLSFVMNYQLGYLDTPAGN